MRTDLGLAHSHLGDPAVVGPGISFHGPRVRLTTPYSVNDVNRRQQHYRLSPPRVVNPSVSFTAQPININYWAAVKSKQNTGLQRRQSLYKLFTPLVGSGVSFHGPGVRLTSPTVVDPRRRSHFSLSPPKVVNPAVTGFIAPPISITYWASVKTKQNNGLQRRQGSSRFSPPTIIGAGIVFSSVNVHLTYSRRGKTLSGLGQPSLLLVGTVVIPGITTVLAPQSKPRAKSHLFAPAVIAAQSINGIVVVHLSRASRGVSKSHLYPPAVVGSGIVFAPIFGTRTYSVRGKPKSVLHPPILPSLAPPVAEAVVTKLVRPEFVNRKPSSHLFPPSVTGNGIYFRSILTHLSYSKRGLPKSELFSPVVIGFGIVFAPLQVSLTPSRRGRPSSKLSLPIIPPLALPVIEKLVTELVRIELVDRQPKSRLYPPSVVGSGIVFRSIEVELAYSLRGKPKSRLSPAAVIGAGITFAPVLRHLAYSRHGQAKSVLRLPIIPLLALPIETKIVTEFVRAELADRSPHSRLFQPAVVDAGIVFRPLDIELAYSLRGKPKSKLFTPSVIGSGTTFAPTRIYLTYSRRGKSLNGLSGPPIITPDVNVFQPPMVVLAPRPNPRTRSALFAPVVVFAASLGAGILIRIAPSRRGATLTLLLPPANVGAGIVFLPIDVELTYSRRGIPKSKLSPATVVGSGIVFESISQHLAYSLRGKPKANLFAPLIPPLALPVKERLVTSLIRTELADRSPHSKLSLPTIVGPGIVFAGLRISIAPSTDIPRRRRAKSSLEPPTVVQAATLLFFGPVEHLAPSKRGLPKSHLGAPAVVGSGIVFRGVLGHLAYSRHGLAKSHLEAAIIPPEAPPIVERIVTQFVRTELAGRRPFSRLNPPIPPPIAPATRIVVARIRPVAVHSILRKPTVIGAGIVFRAIDLTFAPQPKPKPRSRLAPPAVIGSGIVFRPIDELLTPAAPLADRLERRQPHSHLAPPIIPSLAPAIRLTLVRIRPVAVHSVLRKGIVGAGIVFGGLRITTALRIEIEAPRRAPHSHLSPPTSVQPISLVFFGPKTRLTYSSRGKPKSALRAPAVTGAGIVFAPISGRIARTHPGKQRSFFTSLAVIAVANRPILTHLAYSTRGKATYGLGAGIEGAGVFFEQLWVTLTYSVRGKPKSILRAPAVIGAGIVFRPVDIELTYAQRGKAKPHLFTPPAIQPIAPPITEKIVTQLVRVELADRVPHSHLVPPAVIGAGRVFRPLDVELTYSLRGHPRSHLSVPAVLGSGIVFRAVDVELTYSRRGRPQSRLGLPIIPALAPSIIEKIVTQLVRVELAARQPHSRLIPPAVIGAGRAFAPIRGKLAYALRGHPRSHLAAPAVLGSGIVFRALDVTLAPQKRGRPTSVLHQPIVVRLAVLYPIATSLAPSHRGRTLSALSAPVAAEVFAGLQVTLAPSKHGKATSLLFAPTVVEHPLARPIEEMLVAERTRQERTERGPHSHLEPPAIVGAGIVFAPVEITLAPSSHGLAKSHLYKPIVVLEAQPARLLQHLAPSTRGVTRVQFREPIVGQPPFRAIGVLLAASMRGVAQSALRKPAVTGAGIHFRALLVHLAPASRGLAQSRLVHVPAPAGKRGCVTGFDFSPLDISGYDQSGIEVSGSDNAPADVSGSDSGHNVVSGSDTSQTSVSGSDGRNC